MTKTENKKKLTGGAQPDPTQKVISVTWGSRVQKFNYENPEVPNFKTVKL